MVGTEVPYSKRKGHSRRIAFQSIRNYASSLLLSVSQDYSNQTHFSLLLLVLWKTANHPWPRAFRMIKNTFVNDNYFLKEYEHPFIFPNIGHEQRNTPRSPNYE